MKNTQEAVLPNFKSIYPSKVALLDFKPNSREAIFYSMEVYHPPHLSDNKWKILVLQGYIKKRQTSRCSFGNYEKKTFSVFSSSRVANKKSLHKVLDKCLLLYYCLIIQQHTQSTKKENLQYGFYNLFV